MQVRKVRIHCCSKWTTRTNSRNELTAVWASHAAKTPATCSQRASLEQLRKWHNSRTRPWRSLMVQHSWHRIEGTQRVEQASTALPMVCKEIYNHLCKFHLLRSILGVPAPRAQNGRRKRLCDVKGKACVFRSYTYWLTSFDLRSNLTLKLRGRVSPLSSVVQPFTTVTEEMRSSCQPGSGVWVVVNEGLWANRI